MVMEILTPEKEKVLKDKIGKTLLRLKANPADNYKQLNIEMATDLVFGWYLKNRRDMDGAAFRKILDTANKA